jgi:hypothetical protein
MMPTTLLNTCNRVHHRWRLSADSVDARVDTPNYRTVQAKRLKISLLKMPAVRSRLNSQSANAAKRAATPPRFTTPMPELAAKSP